MGVVGIGISFAPSNLPHHGKRSTRRPGPVAERAGAVPGRGCRPSTGRRGHSAQASAPAWGPGARHASPRANLRVGTTGGGRRWGATAAPQRAPRPGGRIPSAHPVGEDPGDDPGRGDHRDDPHHSPKATRGPRWPRDLLNRVWGYDPAVVTRTVHTHVAALRQRLESDPDRPRLILTVRKAAIGFRSRHSPAPCA